MTALRLRAGVWLLLAAGVAIACAVLFAAGAPLQTNILALLPATERNPLAEEAVGKLANAAGNRAVFLLGHRSADEAAAAARDFARRLRESGAESGAFRQVLAEIPPLDPKAVSGLYLRHRFNLLADADRAALAAGDADLDGRLRRKLYAPFRFGLTLSPADDPFGFTDAWISALPLKNLKLEPENGLLAVHRGGTTWIFVSAELAGSAFDSDLQLRVAESVSAAESELRRNHPDAELLRTGPVFYAGAARAGAERDVDRIGTGSLAGMLILLYLVFRSLRPLALGLLSVAFGIGAAAAATVWVYGDMHLITLVFGASLIGEAIDYAVQYFAAHLGAGPDWEPMAGLRRIAPGLTVALSTSLLGYGVLSLAPFPALSQIGLFALVGLFAAWLSVFLLLPALLTRPSKRNPEAAVAVPQRLLIWWKAHMTRRACAALVLLLLALSAPGWFQLKSDDDVHLLVSRPPGLIAEEERIRDLTGFGGSGLFFLVEGGTPDAVLAREEALAARLSALANEGDIAGYQAVSSFVPSAARQAENRALWRDRVFADAAALSALFSRAGLRDDIAPQQLAAFASSAADLLTVDEWLSAPLSSPLRHLWLGAAGGGHAALVVPQGVRDASRLAAAAAGLPGVTPVDKAASVTRLFREYRQWGALWLLGAFCLVYGVLCLRYRWRQAAVVLAPTLFAMVMALGAFGWLGEPVNLFSLMGMMLVLGVGVNYAIFLREGGVRAAATLAGVLLSAGTTLLSFGLLAFSSMPVLASFGLTLLVGVSIAVLLAPMVLSFEAKAAA